MLRPASGAGRTRDVRAFHPDGFLDGRPDFVHEGGGERTVPEIFGLSRGGEGCGREGEVRLGRREGVQGGFEEEGRFGGARRRSERNRRRGGVGSLRGGDAQNKGRPSRGGVRDDGQPSVPRQGVLRRPPHRPFVRRGRCDQISAPPLHRPPPGTVGRGVQARCNNPPRTAVVPVDVVSVGNMDDQRPGRGGDEPPPPQSVDDDAVAVGSHGQQTSRVVQVGEEPFGRFDAGGEGRTEGRVRPVPAPPSPRREEKGRRRQKSDGPGVHSHPRRHGRAHGVLLRRLGAVRPGHSRGGTQPRAVPPASRHLRHQGCAQDNVRHRRPRRGRVRRLD
mmetsp:Transcript_30875/g.92534  ORF Transcript_30875/g.92534 Transcript_30875/m.92534 type:complete len:333 (+) Transcript_30875:270-1268(+)